MSSSEPITQDGYLPCCGGLTTSSGAGLHMTSCAKGRPPQDLGEVAYRSWAAHGRPGKVTPWGKLTPATRERWRQVASSIVGTYQNRARGNSNAV